MELFDKDRWRPMKPQGSLIGRLITSLLMLAVAGCVSPSGDATEQSGDAENGSTLSVSEEEANGNATLSCPKSDPDCRK